MSSPEADEVLFAYIAVAPHAVSLVLIRDDDEVQRLVYYVSKSLHETEVRYLPLKKAILAVMHATKKLPHYFQAHMVIVLTQLPLRAVLRSADYIGRIAMWSALLGAFDIKYMPKSSVKGQVLADLVAEFAEPSVETIAEKKDMDGKSVGTISAGETLRWRVYVDGVANQRGSGIGLVLISPDGIAIEKSLRLGFSATNNKAEYEALLQGMTVVQKLGGRVMEAFSDSKLVVGQVMGELEARDARMQEYLGRVKRLQLNFESFNLTHVSRSVNTHADSLATLATSSAHDLPRMILVKDLVQASPIRRDPAQVHQIRKNPSWMDPIKNFLKDDTLPEGKLEAEKIRRNAPWFWLSEEHKLYRRSYSGPYLLSRTSGSIAASLESLTGTPLPPTPKEMDKLRP
ncbi:uncharacterized protein LOC115949866 [Quercus lobata]|uniref:uncharacterized protein LOC115949866 n=1 Tax=Quercus lobata TaxID=97700 RepID=UPI0012449058|nr:uncharacterized protein LOC115949866 [Quercus lobata]